MYRTLTTHVDLDSTGTCYRVYVTRWPCEYGSIPAARYHSGFWAADFRSAVYLARPLERVRRSTHAGVSIGSSRRP